MQRARAVRPRVPGRDALAGTRSRPPPACRCCGGCATRGVHGARARGARLEEGLAAVRRRVQRVGAMLTLFSPRAGAQLRRRRACDTERYAALFRHLLERGIYVAPSQFEAMFVSLAHSTTTSTARWRPSLNSSATDSGTRSPTRRAPRARCGRRRCAPTEPRSEPVFSPLCRRASHSGSRRSTRATSPLRPVAAVRARRPELVLLLGDYLYAHGLVRIAEIGSVRPSPTSRS